MAFPRELLTEGEEVLEEFRPHWRMLAVPALWTLGAVAVVIVAANLWDGAAVRVITVAAVGAWLYLGAWRFLSWFFTWYVLTNERLITRRGIIARRGVDLPLENINDVQFSQNILERMLSSGDLIIESAGEMGQSRFSDIRSPQRFQSRLYQVREDRVAAIGQDIAKDPTATLERLASLHRLGSISDAEFEEKKKKLLDEI
jgi:uncharacterized membrane protein YdbT with pleckstrin-like domain